MRYLSLFSGIEAASVAWEPLGWEPVAFCEVDEFASAVLAHRYPDVPNLGDITKVDWKKFKEEYGAIDIVAGGSPCTSFSIAGGRESLDGESRLMYEYIRACREVQSNFVLWENVSGCLNTKDNAFAQLLDSLQDCGYCDLSWRVLDAQFFGVAQRRRRVFLVGHLAARGGCSAAVLFDAHSCEGNPPSSKDKRKALAAAAGRGAGGTGGEGCRTVAFAQNQHENKTLLCVASGQANAEHGEGFCPTLSARQFKDPPIVIDRAAFNQGVAAKFPPHVEQTELMDTLVARGPHAVAYRQSLPTDAT